MTGVLYWEVALSEERAAIVLNNHCHYILLAHGWVLGSVSQGDPSLGGLPGWGSVEKVSEKFLTHPVVSGDSLAEQRGAG